MNLNNCHLKLALIEDYEEYYKMRSEKSNLFWTGYEKAPDFIQFKKWYKNRLSNKNRHIYLLVCDNKYIGSLNIDFYSKYAYIGYSVKEAYAKQGIGTYIVKNAVNILKKHKEITLVKAWINYQNIGSIRVVEKNKFQKTGVIEIRNRFNIEEEYIEFGLNLSKK